MSIVTGQLGLNDAESGHLGEKDQQHIPIHIIYSTVFCKRRSKIWRISPILETIHIGFERRDLILPYRRKVPIQEIGIPVARIFSLDVFQPNEREILPLMKPSSAATNFGVMSFEHTAPLTA